MEYNFYVIEHYQDDWQEPHGFETFDHIPIVGETVTLHSPDGKEWAKAVVEKVREFSGEINVRRVVTP